MSDNFRLGIRIKVYNATLRNALTETGKPFYQIATELGIEYTTFSAYINLRKYPTLEHAAVICAYLERPIDEVFPEHLLHAPKSETVRLELSQEEYKKLRAQGGFTNPWGLERMALAEGNAGLEDELKASMATLTAREQRVLTLRFGLKDGRSRTLEEVGREFGVTRTRVSQIEAKALRKLRHPNRNERLRAYVGE